MAEGLGMQVMLKSSVSTEKQQLNNAKCAPDSGRHYLPSTQKFITMITYRDKLKSKESSNCKSTRHFKFKIKIERCVYVCVCVYIYIYKESE